MNSSDSSASVGPVFLVGVALVSELFGLKKIKVIPYLTTLLPYYTNISLVRLNQLIQCKKKNI